MTEARAQFRPSWPYRIMFVLQWPTIFGTIFLTAPTLVFIAWGGVYRWLGLLLAGVLIWGMWRAWNIRVELGEHEVVIANPIRTYRIALDEGAYQFQLGPIECVYPVVMGVELAWMGGRLQMAATAYVSKSEQQRLADQLEKLASRNGCSSIVPTSWAS